MSYPHGPIPRGPRYPGPPPNVSDGGFGHQHRPHNMGALSAQMNAMRLNRPPQSGHHHMNAAAPEFVPRGPYQHQMGAPRGHHYNPHPAHNGPHQGGYGGPPGPGYPMSPQQFLQYEAGGVSYDPYMTPSGSGQPAQQAQQQPLVRATAPHHPKQHKIQPPNPNKMQFYMEIQVGAEQIMTEQDKFEDFAEAIRDRILVEGDLSRTDVETVAGTLLNMAVQIPHVSYPLARLCAYLCEEMEGQTGEAANWAPALSTVWQREHADRLSNLQAAPGRLRLFSIFLAELFSLVRSPEGNQELAYARGVLETCESLLQLQEIQDELEDNAKTVVRILKCCGGSLDKLKIDGGTEVSLASRVGSLISSLQSICSNLPVGETVKKAVGAVVALREADWGRKEGLSSSNSTGGKDEPGKVGPPEEVVYGPDGQQLSEEERAFLSEAFGQGLANNILGEDEESAFEDFLKQNS